MAQPPQPPWAPPTGRVRRRVIRMLVGALALYSLVRLAWLETPSQVTIALPEAQLVPLLQIDINLADSAAWEALPGIGPVTARRIVRYRTAIGGFRTWQDLQRVWGMDTLLPRLADRLVLNPATVPPPADDRAEPYTTALWPDPGVVFDPPADLNALTPAQLQQARLLPDALATRLLRYRDARGGFRNWDDVAQAYGMTPQYLARLQRNCVLRVAERPLPAPALTVVDLNAAEPEELEALPGIGPGRARSIIDYRSRLGFYHSPDQLRELRSLPDSLVQALRPWLTAGQTYVRFKRLYINTATEEQLARHPYIGWELARRLTNYRTQHGYYTSLDDLKQLRELSNTQRLRLQPYLDFSPPGQP